MDAEGQWDPAMAEQDHDIQDRRTNIDTNSDSILWHIFDILSTTNYMYLTIFTVAFGDWNACMQPATSCKDTTCKLQSPQVTVTQQWISVLIIYVETLE